MRSLRWSTAAWPALQQGVRSTSFRAARFSLLRFNTWSPANHSFPMFPYHDIGQFLRRIAKQL